MKLSKINTLSSKCILILIVTLLLVWELCNGNVGLTGFLKHEMTFIVFQIVFILLLFVSFFNIIKCCIGRVFESRELLEFLAEDNPNLRNAINLAKKRKSVGPVHEKANRALYLFRRSCIIYILINFICLVAIFSMATLISSAYYNNSAFKDLSVNDGLPRHIYYVFVTMVTLGYGDIYSLNEYGYTLVIVICLTSLALFLLGLGFLISHWYYLIGRLEKDIEIVCL